MSLFTKIKAFLHSKLDTVIVYEYVKACILVAIWAELQC
jgi:hypothetical protein